MKIRLDDKKFRRSLYKLRRVAGDGFEDKVADTLLTLSRREVPFDTSDLQKSGFADRDGDGAFVAYNSDYATFQHEGMRKNGTFIVRKHKNGRKAKYLEDPLKQNMGKWADIAMKKFNQEIKKNV